MGSLDDILTQQKEASDDFFKTVRMQFDGSNKNIDMITQLHETEIINLARVAVLNNWCQGKAKNIDIFVKRFMRMKVSENRQGRKEFFDTFKQAGQEQAKASMLKKLFGARTDQQVDPTL